MKIKTRHARRIGYTPIKETRTNSGNKIAQTKRVTKYTFFLFILAIIGAFFQELIYGQLLIIIYGVLALYFQIASKESFQMSLICLGCIVALGIIGNDKMAKNFAIYLFLLLIIGVLSACRELWRAENRSTGT